MGFVKSVANSFYTLYFLRLLTQPFEKTEAYKLGIIDAEGNVLKPLGELEGRESDAYTVFHRLVFNIKKLIRKIPVVGKSTLTSYLSALWLIREEIQHEQRDDILQYILREVAKQFPRELENDLTEEIYTEPFELGRYKLRENIEVFDTFGNLIELHENNIVIAESINTDEVLGHEFVRVRYGVNQLLLTTKQLKDAGVPMKDKALNEDIEELAAELTLLREEAPTNSIGSGAGVAGLVGEPPVPQKFMNCRVFDVDAEVFHKCTNGKHPRHRYSRYVGSDEVGEEIREYAKANIKEGIVLRNKSDSSMMFLRRPI